MNVRKTIAGFALVGAVTVGGAASAFAQSNPSSGAPPFPKHPDVTCAQAVTKVADFQARLDHAKSRVEDAKARRDRLVADGHPDQAQKLTDKIQKAEPRIAGAQDKLTKIEQTVKDHCAPDAAAS
ncbi:MAG: hypothetical protein ACR2LQ_04645 [Acidimicrobiales bacterium]